MSKREDLERLLKAEAPDTDFSDDENLYTQVINDYVDYARLLELEQAQPQALAEAELRGRNAAIAEQMARAEPSDGMPHLGGGGATPLKRKSYFDLASEA